MGMGRMVCRVLIKTVSGEWVYRAMTHTVSLARVHWGDWTQKWDQTRYFSVHPPPSPSPCHSSDITLRSSVWYSSVIKLFLHYANETMPLVNASMSDVLLKSFMHFLLICTIYMWCFSFELDMYITDVHAFFPTGVTLWGNMMVNDPTSPPSSVSSSRVTQAEARWGLWLVNVTNTKQFSDFHLSTNARACDDCNCVSQQMKENAYLALSVRVQLRCYVTS